MSAESDNADFLHSPPGFPRIGHLPGSNATDDDEWLADDPAWLNEEVVVEEKLDGSNVAIWRDGPGSLAVAGRAGLGARDRAGQLGRLRAWAASRHDVLTRLLAPGEVLYGEWLWLVHTIHYEQLPDWLIVLDFWTPSRGFLAHDERDHRAREAGLVPAPVLFRGVLGSWKTLFGLCGVSHFASEPMEGVVVRRERDGVLVDRGKWVRPGFTPKPDAAWRPPYAYNRLRAAGDGGESETSTPDLS